MTDCEAVQFMMERLNNTVSEFREVEMKKTQGMSGTADTAISTLWGYLEGDQVWYQPMQGNSWIGPAAVLCQ